MAKKEVKRVYKKCPQCGKIKEIAKNRIKCNKCNKANRERRFAQKRILIANNPEDRLYLCSLPLEPLEGKNNQPTLAVYIHPNNYYGGVKGIELIRKYLSKYDSKKVYPEIQAVIQSRYKHKERWGRLTINDLEVVKEVGTFLTDKSNRKYRELKKQFEMFRKNLKNLDKQIDIAYETKNKEDLKFWKNEKRKFLAQYKPKPDSKFPVDNQVEFEMFDTLGKWSLDDSGEFVYEKSKSMDDLREREIKKQKKEEQKDEGDYSYKDFEDVDS